MGGDEEAGEGRIDDGRRYHEAEAGNDVTGKYKGEGIGVLQAIEIHRRDER